MRLLGWLRGLFKKSIDAPSLAEDSDSCAENLGDNEVEEAGCVDPPPCEDWRQGDVFMGGRVIIFDNSWNPIEIDCAYGVAVISQSCDASLANRLTLQVAPVVKLSGDNEKFAMAGKRPMYALLPALDGGPLFADLDSVTTVDKRALAELERFAGVETDYDVRRFALSVARKYGRFAYPDDVVRAMRPMTEALVSKVAKPNSPLGYVLADVYSFRIECTDWTAKSWNLTLIIVVNPGTLPLDVEEIESRLEEVRDRFLDSNLGGLSGQISKIAMLIKESSDQSERYWAWNCLGEALAEKCMENVKSLDLQETVSSVAHELVSADEFPLSRIDRSEALDLDYLSEPTPRAAPEH
ncbi:hypothetical protein [Rhodococcus erythropolis]|uniref:hypothetical protein n=1 Tax=Rhodococcus erythropolis TaxID=1833 RepID=UPI0036DEC215